LISFLRLFFFSHYRGLTTSEESLIAISHSSILDLLLCVVGTLQQLCGKLAWIQQKQIWSVVEAHSLISVGLDAWTSSVLSIPSRPSFSTPFLFVVHLTFRHPRPPAHPCHSSSRSASPACASWCCPPHRRPDPCRSGPSAWRSSPSSCRRRSCPRGS
jgi:hypothetical protein